MAIRAMEVMLAIALIGTLSVFELHNRKLIDPALALASGPVQSLMGVNIIQAQALPLPGACNVQTPSIGRCNASLPTDSPSGTPNSPPAGTRFNQTFQLLLGPLDKSPLLILFGYRVHEVHLRQYHQQIMEHQMQTRQKVDDVPTLLPPTLLPRHVETPSTSVSV
ncbi:hypothetical protein SADUNF_Sadunf02G0042700 [Salix dunnii]|uniref:Uncharacterized protein n=1 Tax=Salix dunnii TaxID=1413687 RepID=A0A835TII2_9ROSI|nr:hypothetical protein SADUNF_Sadunf02G0042700 [Salix dunnii]